MDYYFIQKKKNERKIPEKKPFLKIKTKKNKWKKNQL